MAIKDDMQDVQEAVINELITENNITNTLAAGQVTETKIANGAVTSAKLGGDVELTSADGSITPAKLDRAYLESTGGTVSGNLGIGVVPSGNLTSGYVLRLDGGAQTYLAFNNDTHTTQVTGGFVVGNDTSAARITQRENQPIIFDTNGSERMRIQANGTIKISNSSVPSTPSGGGVLFVYNGKLYFKGSSGTLTQLASA